MNALSTINIYDLDNDIRVEEKNVAPHSAIHTQTIQKLHQHFGAAPFSRKQFRPTLIPARALAHTCLLDVEYGAEAPVYRYRVFGTDLRETVGIDLAKKTIMDFPKLSCRVYLSHLFNACTKHGKPVFSAANIAYPRGLSLRTEKTFIPMIDPDTSRVGMILTVFTFDFNNNELSTEQPKNVEPLSAHENYQVFDHLGHMLRAIETAA